MAIFSFFSLDSTHYHSFTEVMQVRIGKTLHLHFPSDLSRMKNFICNQVYFSRSGNFQEVIFYPDKWIAWLAKTQVTQTSPLPRFLENITVSIVRTWFDKHIPEQTRGKALIAVLVQKIQACTGFEPMTSAIPVQQWLVSSVGRTLHRYRRGHGFKSRTGLIFFFQAFFSLLLK